MHKLCFGIICLFAVSCQVTTSEITTNGILDDDELANCRQHLLANENQAFVKTTDSVLYVAIVSSTDFWTHLYLSDGNRVKVLHASAAIGSIDYAKNGEIWTTKASEFQYDLGDTIYNDRIKTSMNEYYHSNAWVANNTALGNGRNVEFKINLQEWPGSLFLACVISDYQMKFSTLPASLNDDATLPELVQGYAVDSLDFNPADWTRIK